MRITVCTRAARGTDARLRLFLRIESTGVTRYVSLGERVDAAHWNAKAREVRRSGPNASAMNAMLRRVEATAEAEAQRLRLSGAEATADAVKAATVNVLWPGLAGDAPEPEGGGTPSVLASLAASTDRRRAAGRVGRAQVIVTVRSALSAYLATQGATDMKWGDVTAPFLRGWHAWLYDPAGRGMTLNSASQYLAAFRAVCREAVDAGHMEQAAWPFFTVRLERTPTHKSALSAAQIDALSGIDLSAAPSPRFAVVRDAWMLAFYAGGMRFADVCRLEWGDVQDGGAVLRYRMGKTGKRQSVPMLPEARAIVARMQAARPGARRIFPFLSDADRTPLAEYRAIGSANAVVNAQLKYVGAAAGVPGLTFHMARHSLARYLRARGWDVRAIQQVLRHSSVAITERYLSDLDDDGLGAAYRDAFAP